MEEDDIWDNWEDFADSNELDRHVDEQFKMTNGNCHQDESDEALDDFDINNQSFGDNNTENDKNSGVQFRILPRPVVHEDDQNRTAYKPQVKILRRPGKDSQADIKAKDKQKSQPARTLAEREAAYAEARKRIMGPVTTQEKANPPSTSKNRSESRKTKNQKSESTKNNVQVDRLPKGPDKTGRGFLTPR